LKSPIIRNIPLETIKGWITPMEENVDEKEREELKLEHALEDNIKISHAEISAVKV
jgi:hypothetical protein